jgi:hypothetical protein
MASLHEMQGQTSYPPRYDSNESRSSPHAHGRTNSRVRGRSAVYTTLLNDKVRCGEAAV